MDAVVYASVTISHASVDVSGQTSYTRVTDPSVLEGNANVVLAGHVFYSKKNLHCGFVEPRTSNLILLISKSRHNFAYFNTKRVSAT